MDLGRIKRLGNIGSRLSTGGGLPIAIDFGAGSLKILQIADADAPTLVSGACVETPDDLLANPAKRLAFQIEALPNLIRSAGFKGKRAVCGIPAGHTIVKHMQATRTPGVSLGDTVEQGLCLQLGCAQGSVLVRHFEVDAPARAGSNAKTEVICIAAARDLVTGLMKAIKDAKLEPVGIHSEPVATLRAFDHVNRRADDQTSATLYLDIGTQTTNLTIGHGERLVFARKIDFGGHRLDEAIDNQFDCGILEARRRRFAAESICSTTPAPTPPASEPDPEPEPQRAPGSTGIPALDALMKTQEADAPATVAEDRREGQPAPGLTTDVLEQPAASLDLAEPVEILTDEIAMCLRYHASLFPDVPLARAIFLGGEARQLALCQHVARAVRLPAQAADPMARVARTGSERVVGVDFSQPQPGWSVALGLCLSPTDL